MSEHPKFEEFKRRALANPEVRRAYVAAKVRRKRDEAALAAPASVPGDES